MWLWNAGNVPEWRRAEFDALKHAELKTSCVWAIKESLQGFWAYVYPGCAEKYFTPWYFWATHSCLVPLIAATNTLKRHQRNLLTYFHRWITNATSEGINSKMQTPKLMACGYRNRDHYRMAILFIGVSSPYTRVLTEVCREGCDYYMLGLPHSGRRRNCCYLKEG